MFVRLLTGQLCVVTRQYYKFHVGNWFTALVNEPARYRLGRRKGKIDRDLFPREESELGLHDGSRSIGCNEPWIDEHGFHTEPTESVAGRFAEYLKGAFCIVVGGF